MKETFLLIYRLNGMEEKSLLGHERLSIYPISIEFIEWITKNIFKNLAGDSKIADQLSRASSSIPLNIAEGSGKLTEKDKKRFYSIARGSAMECSAIF
ncbi:MAG: four helix bundle protein, partial [Bdellovibrionales bacterium]|nr:four helix bundle protein [Bdellovibrionales bacterium]